MRRRVGLGAIQQQKLAAEKYKDKGTDLQENQLEQMTKQMEVFRVKLEEFAMKHKEDIRKNSQFRKQFQEMCAAIGVDPLATGKGFWSVLGMGDFYYELGVQVVEVCLAANHKTGGLMELDDLRRRLIAARGQSSVHQEITKEDILMAAKKLSIFGNGYGSLPLLAFNITSFSFSITYLQLCGSQAGQGQVHSSVHSRRAEHGGDKHTECRIQYRTRLCYAESVDQGFGVRISLVLSTEYPFDFRVIRSQLDRLSCSTVTGQGDRRRSLLD